MIPVYIFYSMFGFQRTADSIWAMADQLARGFLIGATAGRTTLTGEGLQHADGHSPLLALTNPAVVHYDPAFAYEIAHIVQDGLAAGCTARPATTRTARTSSTTSPSTTSRSASRPSPRTSTSTGLLRGHLPRRRPPAASPTTPRGSSCSPPASGCRGSQRAQQLLADDWGVGADLWSVTSWNELSREALAAEEWNLMHPIEEQRTPYVTQQARRRRRPGRRGQRLHARGAAAASRAGCRSASTRSAPTGSASPTPGRPPAGSSRSTPSRSSARRSSALAEEGRVGRDAVQKALDHYRIDDPTAVSGVKQEGGDA